jgi:hypothetical protein
MAGLLYWTEIERELTVDGSEATTATRSGRGILIQLAQALAERD